MRHISVTAVRRDCKKRRERKEKWSGRASLSPRQARPTFAINAARPANRASLNVSNFGSWLHSLGASTAEMNLVRACVDDYGRSREYNRDRTFRAWNEYYRLIEELLTRFEPLNLGQILRIWLGCCYNLIKLKY